MKKRLATALVLVSLIAGACGDGDDDTSAPSPETTAQDGPVKLAYIVAETKGVEALTGTDRPGLGEDHNARTEREFKALVDDVNEKGGIKGRTVEARGFAVSLAEQADSNALVQHCVRITEDFGADFVIDTTTMAFEVAQKCYADHGTVIVTLATTLADSTVASFAPYVATTWPTVDRQFAALPAKLDEIGFFDNAKVGVFLDDVPGVNSTYEKVMAPALKKAGGEPVAVAKAAYTDAAKVANAVLQFKGQGVTHVVFVGNLLHFLTFSNAADTQGFRPRYAFPDYSAIASAVAAYAKPDQLKDAVAVSTCDFVLCISEGVGRSSRDIVSPYDLSSVSPGFRRCIENLSRVRGTDYTKPKESGQSLVFPFICDHFQLWLEAARRAPSLDPEGWGQGLEMLGTRYQSTRTHGTDFSKSQAGGATFAAGVYDGTCQCYVRKTAWTKI